MMTMNAGDFFDGLQGPHAGLRAFGLVLLGYAVGAFLLMVGIMINKTLHRRRLCGPRRDHCRPGK